jgi:hypothetical protein
MSFGKESFGRKFTTMGISFVPRLRKNGILIVDVFCSWINGCDIIKQQSENCPHFHHSN